MNIIGFTTNFTTNLKSKKMELVFRHLQESSSPVRTATTLKSP